jgi:hypothetical protein
MMVIIDLMTALMGVSMGFLAFLVIGGISGASTWIFYPSKSSGPGLIKLLLAVFLGFIAALDARVAERYFCLLPRGLYLYGFS